MMNNNTKVEPADMANNQGGNGPEEKHLDEKDVLNYSIDNGGCLTPFDRCTD
jgi:hypothetical protein